MATEQFLPGAPIAPGTQVIASPTQFLFTGAEALRVITYRIAFQDDLVIQGRFRADIDGVVKPFSFALPGGPVEPSHTYEFPFPAGTLFNIRVAQAVTDTTPFNDTFVQVQQIIGLGAAATVIGTLLQGYLSIKSDLGWPGSPLGNVHDGRGATASLPTNQISSSPIIVAISGLSGQRHRLVSARFDITTSAVAGARGIFLQGASDASYFLSAALTTIGPSSVRTICFAPGMPGRALDAGSVEWLPCPGDLEIDENGTVELLLTNPQAGDTVTPTTNLTYRWFEY